jgi:hypothetical protein
VFYFLYVHFTRILFLRVFLFFFLFLRVFLNLLVAWILGCLRFRPPAVRATSMGVLSGGGGGVLSGGGGGVLSGEVLSGEVLSCGGVGGGGVLTDAYNVIAFLNLSMYFLVLASHFSAS